MSFFPRKSSFFLGLILFSSFVGGGEGGCLGFCFLGVLDVTFYFYFIWGGSLFAPLIGSKYPLSSLF